MPITSQFDEQESTLNILIEEQFDFSKHQDFKDCYSEVTGTGTDFIIDLSKTSYMDSSALGMILLLREHANSFDGRVVIRKPTESVYKVLEIAQFQKLIDIER